VCSGESGRESAAQTHSIRKNSYAAVLRLDLPQSDKRLVTFVETDGCFADGVAVATGCTPGHRTMRLVDFGEFAATFADTQSEREIRIVSRP